MKYLLALLATSALASGTRAPRAEFSYTYNDKRIVSAVERGVKSWGPIGVPFKRVASNGDFSIAWKRGEDYYVGVFYSPKRIYLNSMYERELTSKAWAGVTAHEVGHYLGLPHNSERGSTMNSNEDYDTMPSKKDIARAKKAQSLRLIPTNCEGR